MSRIHSIGIIENIVIYDVAGIKISCVGRKYSRTRKEGTHNCAYEQSGDYEGIFLHSGSSTVIGADKPVLVLEEYETINFHAPPVLKRSRLIAIGSH